MAKNKKVKALFVGRDGSCGFRKGSEYSLMVTTLSYSMKIEVFSIPQGNHCSYDSMHSFLDNWDNINNVK